jgi:hypothetical protein
LCDKALIDHQTTFQDHPKAYGLIKHVVQTVKMALRKYGLQKGHLGDWDIQSPWLAMGYRFSHHASLASFSPYFLLYGRDLDLLTMIHRESSELVNLDDSEMWLRVCFERVELFRKVMPTTFENLAIAQHKDTLRYAIIWGGGYQPSIHRFHVATPLWPSVGVKPNTPKVGDLESSGTPECFEFDNKAQNTSHWGVLSVIGKFLNRRYRKWPRIGHLDICSPSYGQKKGRESN